MAYDAKVVGLHAPIKVRVTKEIGGEQVIPHHRCHCGSSDLQRSHPAGSGLCGPQRFRTACLTWRSPSWSGKKQLGKIIDRCIRMHGTASTAEVLDRIKAQGFKYSTRSGLTVAVVRCGYPA